MLSESDRDVWDRILFRMMKECQSLQVDDADKLQSIAEETLDVPNVTTMAEYQDAVRKSLNHLLERCIDESSNTKERREALNALQAFRKKIRTTKTAIPVAATASTQTSDPPRQTTKKRPREETVTTNTSPSSNNGTPRPLSKAPKLTPAGMAPIPQGIAERFGFVESLPHLTVSTAPPKTGEQRRTYCRLCDVWFQATGMTVAKHCQGRTHQTHLGTPLNQAEMIPVPYPMAKRLGVESSVRYLVMTPPSQKRRMLFCKLCQVMVGGVGELIATHCQGKQHRAHMKEVATAQLQSPPTVATTKGRRIEITAGEAAALARAKAASKAHPTDIPQQPLIDPAVRTFPIVASPANAGRSARAASGQSVSSPVLVAEASRNMATTQITDHPPTRAVPAPVRPVAPVLTSAQEKDVDREAPSGSAAAAQISARVSHASASNPTTNPGQGRKADLAAAPGNRGTSDKTVPTQSRKASTLPTTAKTTNQINAAASSNSLAPGGRTTSSGGAAKAPANPPSTRPEPKPAPAPVQQTSLKPALKNPKPKSTGPTPMTLLNYVRQAPSPTTITAHADPRRPTLTCSYEPRPNSVKVTFQQVAKAPTEEVERMRQRIADWDPFHPVVFDMGIGVTSPVLRTNPTFPEIQTGGVWCFATTAARAYIQRDTSSCQVLLRMIPRKATVSKKRADCHLWPKGTLLQVNSKPMELVQRKQQFHNRHEWKHVCHPFDLTATCTMREKDNIEVALTAYDASTYVCHLSVCRKLTPKELCANILQQRTMITFLDHAASVAKAKRIAATCNSFFVVDDGDSSTNVASTASEQGKFVFSLLCPLTKKPIVSPVRGKHCKHWQCFDLESFLNVNNVRSGTQWRCGACEQFVSLRALEYCQLTAKIIQQYSTEIQDDQDRVEYRADGTYELLSKRKKRYKVAGPKTEARSDSGGGGGHATGEEPEVIDLL